MAAWIVRARSCAEMPVVTPCRASIETVKAVSNADSPMGVCRPSSSWSQRASSSARQIRPRPWRAMKFTTSAVANWAPTTRSPSFSRSSASVTTTMRPSAVCAIASSAPTNISPIAPLPVLQLEPERVWPRDRRSNDGGSARPLWISTVP